MKGAESHQDHLDVALLELLQCSSFSSMTTKVDGTCLLDPHCGGSPRGLTIAAITGTRHLTASPAISSLDNESKEHGPVGLNVAHLLGTYLKLLQRSELKLPLRDVGPAKSDWCSHNQLVNSWQHTVWRQNNLSTRLPRVRIWTPLISLVICDTWCPDLKVKDVPPRSHHQLIHQNPAGESLLKLPSSPYCMLQWFCGYFLICSHFFQSTLVMHPSAQDNLAPSKIPHAGFNRSLKAVTHQVCFFFPLHK